MQNYHRHVLIDLCKLLCRGAVGTLFVIASFKKGLHFQHYQGIMSQAGLAHTEWFLSANVLLEGIGGMMLIIGYRSKLAASVLLIIAAFGTFCFHDFLDYHLSQMPMRIADIASLLTVTVCLIYIIIMGPGKYRFLGKKARQARDQARQAH